VTATTLTELRILRSELLEAHRELTRLRIQNEQLMTSNKDLCTLLVNTERRSGELIKIIVAFRRLLESTDALSALRSIEEILVNIVGTEDFVVLLVTDTPQLRVVAGRGPSSTRAQKCAPSFDSLYASKVKVVPLYIAEHAVGAIAVDQVLPHRDPLNANDDQVLALLSRFAAAAVMAAEHKKDWKRVPLAEVA
jgi:hypothetical protein